MDVRNCKECSRLFNYLSGLQLCPECLKKLDEKFTKVKQYIYDNPGVGISMVAEANDVTVPQIKRWVREERLTFADDSLVGIECEQCGTMIRSGRFCDTCKAKIASGLGSVYQKKTEVVKKPVKDSAKMRFLD